MPTVYRPTWSGQEDALSHRTPMLEAPPHYSTREGGEAQQEEELPLSWDPSCPGTLPRAREVLSAWKQPLQWSAPTTPLHPPPHLLTAAEAVIWPVSSHSYWKT